MEPYANDGAQFQLLQALQRNPEAFLADLEPSKMDKLSLEVSLAYQRCSVPSVSPEEREINEFMAGCIGTLDSMLSCRTDAKSGAMLVLFRRVILTPANLEALCKMCLVRTGHVQRHAVWHLKTLSSVRSCWTIQFKDGSSLALNIVKALTRLLAPPSSIDQITMQTSWSLLAIALGVLAGEPVETYTSTLLAVDWPPMLQGQKFPVKTEDPVTGELTWWDMVVFICLHRLAGTAVQHYGKSTSRNNNPGVELLEKLGACDPLFRNVLRRVISGEVWSPTSRGTKEKFEELPAILNFLVRFLYCLVPLQNCRELDALMRRTRNILLETFMHSLLNETETMAKNVNMSMVTINETNFFFSLVDGEHWEKLKAESQDDRWCRFERRYLQGNGGEGVIDDGIAKRIKNVCKKNLKMNTNLSDGEMCANCFVLEKDIRDKLSKCSRCLQVRYCSRE